MYKVLFPLLFLLLTVGCYPESENTDSNELTGLWSLHIMEKRDSITGKWNEWSEGMQGYILYDGQAHMSLHLTTKGYEKIDFEFPNFTDTISEQALKHLTNSYVYFAEYSIDEKESIVEHARISHSNPGMWNEVVQRRYSFSGDTLILQPVEKKLDGLRLKWIKKPGAKK